MEICLSEAVTPYFSSIFLDRSFMQKKTITHYFFTCEAGASNIDSTENQRRSRNQRKTRCVVCFSKIGVLRLNLCR